MASLSPAQRSLRTVACRTSAHANGVTLLELLLVIAVITLLVGILLPSLRGGRQRARRMECQSNLRQVAAEWRTYTDEKDGALPDVASLPFKAAGVLRCPSDNGSDTVQPSFFERLGASYRTNPFLVGGGASMWSPGEPCEAVFKRLTARPLGRSAMGQMPDVGRLALSGDYGWVDALAPATRQRIEWHARACSHNLAFVDGHADFVRIRKGLFVSGEYLAIPFADLVSEIQACQQEMPCDP